MTMSRTLATLGLCFAMAACGSPRSTQTDTGGTDAGGSTGGAAENTDALCSNDKDDDNDGFSDCADIDCTQSQDVTVCRGEEASVAACHDGEDNDGDGDVDCADVDCEPFECFENTDALCSDGEDQDDDGYSDCEDLDCQFACGVTVCGRENTPEQCGDGEDNDGDGRADCDDTDCKNCVDACDDGNNSGENDFAKCTDGEDNDDDGAVDCQDIECLFVDAVEACDTGEENTDAKCSDGEDNDNDPYVDCEDRDCQGYGSCVENTNNLCSDGVDNDGNGYVDCEDFDCQDACGVTVCEAENTQEKCTNGTDDDGDGRVDCDDFGCRDCVAECGGTDGGDAGGTGENTVELCTNEQDDDDDGDVDCGDVECLYVDGVDGCNTGQENTEDKCSDGEDNDNDPFVDCDDTDCSGIGDCVEDSDAACQDGQDNDADGYVDCDDYDCSDNPSVSVCGEQTSEDTGAACDDGEDNDGDGDVDCDDVDCSNNPALEVCPVPIETTIEALQNPDAPDAVTLPSDEPFAKVRVKLTGVTVTSGPLPAAADEQSFFVQEAFPPEDTRFKGIRVFVREATPEIAPGDLVNVVGFYTEFYGESQLTFGKLEAVGSGAAPAATELETQDVANVAAAEAYEGVLIRLGPVQVTQTGILSGLTEDGPANDFRVAEASAVSASPGVIVSTQYVAQAVQTGDSFGAIAGIWVYSYDKYRLAPRLAGDYVTSAGSGDTDADGLSDGQENDLGTDPTAADSDGDGTEDASEVGDPAQPADADCDGIIDALDSSSDDSDGDGVVDQNDPANEDGPQGDADDDGTPNSTDGNDDGDDYCDPDVGTVLDGVCTQLGDNCPAVANNDQADADGDGLGDACDPDVDGDGICDPDVCVSMDGQCNTLNDNCAQTANADQQDGDDDGRGDACDNDLDNDGICNTAITVEGVCEPYQAQGDNCRETSNPLQKDNDDDGIGDACDRDDDNDGVCDPGVQPTDTGCQWVDGTADNCPLTHNPDQVDSDGDGEGDACEQSASLPSAEDVIINEILADPNGAGDANGDSPDGTADAEQDEFIELVNVSGVTLDLGECVINDLVGERFAFDPDTAPHLLEPQQGLVIFAGGSPTGDFGGSAVYVAGGILGMNNGGDTITLECGGNAIDSVTYGSEGGDNQSLTRELEGDPEAALVKHTEITGENGAVYSPGRCADGVRFEMCLPTP